MAKPPVKKRPYDAMRDESSRAIDAMPYTEAKPKPKPAPKPAPKAAPKPAPKRSADWYMKNETAMPGKFKRGGSVKMAAGGSFSEAFRAARKAGKSDFSWNGKKYTTELRGEAKTPPKAAAPTSAPAPAKKPPTFGETIARAAGFRGEKKPEAPKTQYRQMMDESAAGQRKQAEADAAARAARTRAIREANQKKDRTPAPAKPEAPSYGQSNLAAYRRMMGESAEARREETKRRGAAFKARGEEAAAKREAQRLRDNARPNPGRIDLNPFPSKEESAAARAKATSVRNAVSGRPGQAKAKGGKVKAKKRYV